MWDSFKGRTLHKLTRASARLTPKKKKLAHFSKIIFKDTEVVWGDLFAKMGKSYQEPKLVLFSGQVDSACGQADAAVGPFYCGSDARVYIDLSFYKDMQRKLHAPGDFARAYVIAHEVGHHVQRLLGYSQRAREGRSGGSKADANRTSVRLELQADYLAGVWAYHGQKRFHFLDPGDIESAAERRLRAVGDDRLQKRARGYVVPDSFTHGTSKQRQHWFLQGFQTAERPGAAYANCSIFPMKASDHREWKGSISARRASEGSSAGARRAGVTGCRAGASGKQQMCYMTNMHSSS